jgi:hypothetical protein
MIKLRISLVTALLLVPLVAHAQTIRGTVVDDDTRSPVGGVLVELMAIGETRAALAETDSAGAFLLRPEHSGRFVLRLHHLAYTAVQSDTVAIGSGETVLVEMRIAHAAIPLEPLTVTARRDARITGFYERQQSGGFGRFLTRAEIERRRGSSVTDLLRGMPGVRIVPVRTCRNCPPVNLIHMRGGIGGCEPTLYLDGIVVRQFPEGGMDEFLRTAMLEGVEIYTPFASSPSAISALNSCGVVAFWTRSDNLRPWSWTRFAAGAGIFSFLIWLVR